ncbi:hypothetical protein EBZ35_07850 [bacterium]|nr:hypothetical protein [bacterium]
MPTPVETLTSPPLPLLEELEPAEMSTAPPSPASEEPTSRERLPAVPLVAEPVDTTTGPEEPLALTPLPTVTPPLEPLLPAPLPRTTDPLVEELDAPVTRERLPDAPEEDKPVDSCTAPEVPEAAAPEPTTTLPVGPCIVVPVRRVALPLTPAPVTLLVTKSSLPDPVEMPTPVETLTSPPWPFEEELEPAEMTSLVVETERAWQSLGQVRYGPTEAEQKSTVFRRSIYVAADIAAGEMFTESNIRIVRPGLGAPPSLYRDLLGRSARRNFRRGEPLITKHLF